MGFTGSISSGFNKYGDFSSRSSRSEYWYWALFTFIGYTVAIVIDALTTGFLLYFLFALVTLIPTWAVAVRRLHDVNKSGWWTLIGLIPFVGSVMLLIWGVTEGTVGDNKYGADPTERSTQPCPQCGELNAVGSATCGNCAAVLPGAMGTAEVPIDTSGRFLTPVIALVVGLIFSLVLLQATRLGIEDSYGGLGYGITAEQLEALRASEGKVPVLFSPIFSSSESWSNRRKASDIMWPHFSSTLEILILGGALAVLLTWGLGMVIGTGQSSMSGVRAAIGFLSGVPIFWLGLVMIWLFAVKLEWLPAGFLPPFSEEPGENIRHLLMPVFTLGLLGGLAASLEMRNRVSDSASVVLARAAGLILRHSGMLLTGLILVELVFGIPGVGRLFITAIFNADGPVIGITAALLVWIAIIMRVTGNFILSEVGEVTEQERDTFARSPQYQSLIVIGAVTAGLVVLLLLLPSVAPKDPLEQDLRSRLVGSGGDFLLGADHIGRDIFSRILHAGRTVASISLPLALLAIVVGLSMAAARSALERAPSSAPLYVVEGVLEGLCAVPWLIVGALVAMSVDQGWPWVALVVILLPRMLRVGWNIGAGQGFNIALIGFSIVQLGALFLAAAAVVSFGLGFLGMGVSPPTPNFGGEISDGRNYLEHNASLTMANGIVASLVVGIWLVVASLAARTGEKYRAVGWIHAVS